MTYDPPTQSVSGEAERLDREVMKSMREAGGKLIKDPGRTEPITFPPYDEGAEPVTDDREPFRTARDAGLKQRHEQRLARAQAARAGDLLAAQVEPWLQLCGACDAALPMACTCPDGDYRVILMKVWVEYQAGQGEAKSLAETATKLGYELGRKETAEAIAQRLERVVTNVSRAVETIEGTPEGQLATSTLKAYRHAAEIARDISKGDPE